MEELFDAAATGDVEKIIALISNGVDINSIDEFGITSLMYATISGQKYVSTLLIKNGAKIDTLDICGRNIYLSGAIQNGNIELCKIFIDSGANINAIDLLGNNHCLLQALEAGNNDLCKMFLDNGADIHKEGLFSANTYLDRAIQYGNAKACILLIEYGVKIEHNKTQIANTLAKLNWWTQDHRNILLDLTPERADNSIATCDTITPLHFAIICGNLEATKFLINGANLNMCLHIAVFTGRQNIVEYLLQRGANPKSENVKKQTKLHVACLRGHIQIIPILKAKIEENLVKEKQAGELIGKNINILWQNRKKSYNERQLKIKTSVFKP